MTVFEALLKRVSVGCKDDLLPPGLGKGTDVNCLTYKANKERCNENICLLRAIGMHETRTEWLELETLKLLNQYLVIIPNITAENFRGVAVDDLHIVELFVEAKFLGYYIEVSDNGTIGEVAELSLRRISSAVFLLRYNFHICYVTDVKKVRVVSLFHL